MNKFFKPLGSLLLMVASLAASPLVCAENQLYETGPAEDSSYVRFVNATENPLTITSSKKSAKLELNALKDGLATKFFAVKSGTELFATVQGKGGKITVKVVGKAWEYITIAILPDAPAHLKTVLVNETQTDFNAMRASLALLNLDETCGGATMQGGAKHVTILDQVKPYSVQRRLLNPVKLTAALSCADKSGNASVDMPQLQAGERYSVLLLNLKNKRQAFFMSDSN